MRIAGSHAVVLGASMAGLLAARVLADPYDRVTLVERDPLPASELDRKGVPQARRAHPAIAVRVLVGNLRGRHTEPDGVDLVPAGERIQ